MRKFVSFMFAAALVVALAGCGTTENGGEPSGSIVPPLGDYPNYVAVFQAFSTDETLDSFNNKLGVTGVLANPEVSQVSYLWDIDGGHGVTASVSSSGRIASAELIYDEKQVTNSNISISQTGLDELRAKDDATYDYIKSRCGDNGLLVRFSASGTRTYVWLSDDYKLSATFDAANISTNITGGPRI
ncbi:MAG: hypothetical protein LBL34_02645 [Clostridiales bacterium]|jgi:hypothetical protein|nr:hypothetical protein [Clostridiales bacterium]